MMFICSLSSPAPTTTPTPPPSLLLHPPNLKTLRLSSFASLLYNAATAEE